MKKIMFNDKYGLTQAVLEGRKTMTRRIVPIDTYNMTDWKEVEEGNYMAVSDVAGNYFDIRFCGNYGIGDVLAIAQAYKVLDYTFHGYATNPSRSCGIRKECAEKHKGWNNKMFVEAIYMPHRIKITDIKVEQLQDISDEDCMKEGIYVSDTFTKYSIHNGYSPQCTNDPKEKKWWFSSPKEAFAALIDKVSGKGTWKRNPWCFCYEFELMD
ncbi:MAG: hypothetical protein K6G73_12235 [Marinilabiliaceae bacterium]|nr:hypothetical protein [Marinilabiliaceae bacterium]